MSDLRKAAEQALEALDCIYSPLHVREINKVGAAMEALRAALAKPEQEPVACIHRHGNHWEVCERYLCDDEKARGWTEEPLYNAPPQRKQLTDEAYRQLMKHAHRLANDGHGELAQYLRDAIDIAHGIGGNP